MNDKQKSIENRYKESLPVRKETFSNELTEYLIPDKFPVRIVALSDQAVYTAVQQTNATPKSTLRKFNVVVADGLRWTENGVPFLKLAEGYVKADKENLILLSKKIMNFVFEDVTQVTMITPAYFYTDISLAQESRTSKQAKRGESVSVDAVEWTRNGLPRLRTQFGYLTANKDFVSVHNKSVAIVQKILRKGMKMLKAMRKLPKRVYNKTQHSYFELTYNLATRIAKIDNDKVLFLSDSRDEISGNFSYIVDEMDRQNLDFKKEFFLKKTNNEHKTWREYTKLAWGIATSRYVILDDFYPLVYPLKIRDGVDLIQVWHAVGAFKTFGFSRVGKPGGPTSDSKNHRNYDYAIVSSHNVAPFYAEGFGIDIQKVLPLGAPRTDLFFDDAQKNRDKKRLLQEIPYVQGKKVILFAPTFRGLGQNTAYYPYEWLNLKALYEKLAPQGFVFLMKIHPFVKNKLIIPEEYSDFFYDVSDYREINDLLLVSDVLITDYSSVVFEYSLLNRKTIFFTPDLEEYIAERDFYVDYKNFVPGPIVTDMKKLVHEIETYDAVDTEILNNFLTYYFDDLDGHASKRFVDKMVSGFSNL